MNKLSRKYLSGKTINVYYITNNVEVLPAGVLEKAEPDNLYIKTRSVEQKLDEFFDNLEEQLEYEMHEFVTCTDKSFTIRYKEDANYYREETFYFSESTLENSLVKKRFDRYIEHAKEQYPYYEDDAQEEMFAANISNAIFGNTSLDMTRLQDIPEFKEFYEKHRESVEEVLHERFKKKVWPYWLDSITRILALIALNIAFFAKQKLPVLIAIDVALGLVIEQIDIAIQKTYIKSSADKKINKGIHNLQNRKLNSCSGFKKKVLKAIKADIELTEYMKYDGYQEVIKTLYELADTVISSDPEAENTNERTDKMSDVLNKLIDIEQIICIQMNYNGELNAEMLLNEYQGTPEDSNTMSIPDDEKRLLFQ